MARIERTKLRIHTSIIRRLLRDFAHRDVMRGDKAWIECFPTNPTEEQVLAQLDRLDAENNGFLH